MSLQTATGFRKLCSNRFFAIVTAVAMLATLGGVAYAVQVGGGTSLGFEIDGDFTDSPLGGAKDWDVVTPIMVTDDTADSGFTQGSKELKPSDWVCSTGGADPNKGNILRAYANTRVDASGAFVDLAWVAQNISGVGDVHLNFEFSQQGSAQDPNDFTAGPCSIPRQSDDLLVTYDFPGGLANPNIQVFTWEPLANPTGSADGNWVNLNITDAAADAAVNAATMQDPFDGSINPQRFGEAAIDLLAALPPGALSDCQDFGYLNVRSRSSGESETSSIQDKLPSTAIDLNTCGKIKLKKVDDHVPPQALAGAVFGLWDNAATTGTPLDTQSTDAAGDATFDDVKPGDYWVKEISAPANYTKDPDIVKVTVGFRETVVIGEAFVDPRDVGKIRIVKKLADENGTPVVPDDASDLDGASFLVFQDGNGNGTYQSGEAAKLWPNETAVAECTVSGGAGFCDVGPLPTGTYGVHETAAPAGTSTGSDIYPVNLSTNGQTVTVNYVNSLSPLNITLDKSGEDKAHVGDTIHYTFKATTSGPKLHDLVVAEVGIDRCDGSITGPIKSGDQDAFLEPGETWTYGCNHVVTNEDPDPLPNEAKVTGTDDFGRDVSDSDTHSVIILKPEITLDKKVEGADHKPIANALQAHIGDTLDYTVVITNTGDAALQITALADSLKTSLSASCTAGIGATLAPNGTISCAYTRSATTDERNVAAVTGVDELGGIKGTRSASDETFVDVIAPDIEIVKDGPGMVHAGEFADFTFKVTNTGDVALSDVEVTDDQFGAVGTIASLAAGQSQTITKNFKVPGKVAGTNCDEGHYNVATVTAEDPIGGDVSDTDDHCTELADPSIEVVKDGPGMVHAGDAATFTFKVTNTGNVALTNVAVTDDQFGAIGTVGSLAIGASQTITKDFTVPGKVAAANCPAGHYNVATATGVDPLDKTVSDDDDHCTELADPSIEVVKSGPGMAHAGDTVTYTFKVTNTGDVPLVDVAVVDNEYGSIGTIGSLAVGQSETITKDLVVPGVKAGINCDTGHYNIATASGVDPIDLVVTDTDDHCVEIADPSIEVVKDGPGQVHAGDLVTYTFKVTNTGDVALTDVVVTDDEFGSIGTLGTLAVGESKTITKDLVVPGVAPGPSCDDGHYNVATAVGTDPLDLVVDDTDDHCATVIDPAIEVVKDGAALAHEGDTVTYTFKVTNTGDVPLVDVTVTDDVLGDIGTIGGTFAVGATETLSKDFAVPEDTDEVTNIATACGTDPIDLEVCDEDPHDLIVIHPSVEIVKTADPETGGPRDVTFTYVVTNTGDTTLSDILVTDDILGDIGTIDELAAGESATLTKTVPVDANSPTVNIGEACGTDALGLEVCDTDDAEIAVVLAVTLPRTGLGLRMWLLFSGLALALGAAGLNLELTTTTTRVRGRKVQG